MKRVLPSLVLLAFGLAQAQTVPTSPHRYEYAYLVPGTAIVWYTGSVHLEGSSFAEICDQMPNKPAKPCQNLLGLMNVIGAQGWHPLDAPYFNGGATVYFMREVQ